MGRQPKFQPLTDYLLNRSENNITLTFSQIEKILGFSLEPSYRRHRENWANNTHERPYRACISAGYKFDYINMNTETVILIKERNTVETSRKTRISKPIKKK